MIVLAKIPVRMTVDEFLKWDSEDGRRYELVDGEPRAMAPASAIHGFLQNELGRLIGNHLRDKATGCDVIANPGVVPRLLSEHNVRIPDLAVTCSPLAVGQATLPDPILLIEILSPTNWRWRSARHVPFTKGRWHMPFAKRVTGVPFAKKAGRWMRCKKEPRAHAVRKVVGQPRAVMDGRPKASARDHGRLL
jgi:hypothetical protein